MSLKTALAIAVIVIAAGFATLTWVGATTPTPQPGALAEPQSSRQVGFPVELYGWVMPADNPQAPDKVALGKALFFDPRLSSDNTVACANCHDPEKGFTDQLPDRDGRPWPVRQRNAPTVLNALFNIEQFWDGRAPTPRGSGQAADSQSDRDGDAEPGRRWSQSSTASPNIRSNSRRCSATRPTTTTWRKRDRRLRAHPARLRFALRSLHGRRRERADRAAAAGLGDLQRQGPLHVVSRRGIRPSRCSRDNRFHNIGVSAHK